MCWEALSKNPNALYLFEIGENFKKINWKELLKNPNAIYLFEKYSNTFHHLEEYDNILYNPNLFEYLTSYYKKIDDYKLPSSYFIEWLKKYYWIYVSKYCTDIDFMKNNLEKLDLFYLVKNPNAIDILNNNIDILNDNIDLSENPNAYSLLRKNIHLINWSYFSKNTNPNAINFLNCCFANKINWKNLSKNPSAIWLFESNLDKICWSSLSSNPNAIGLLTENLDKINWHEISKNTNENIWKPYSNDYILK